MWTDLFCTLRPKSFNTLKMLIVGWGNYFETNCTPSWVQNFSKEHYLKPAYFIGDLSIGHSLKHGGVCKHAFSMTALILTQYS